MTFAPFRTDRHVIPPWRPFARTVALGELAHPPKQPKPHDISTEFQKRLSAWRQDSNVIHSSEVVESALIESQEAEGVRAARILVAPNSTATNLVKHQARVLLRRVGESDCIELSRNALQVSAVARARSRTRVSPHDPFGWTDLALGYLTLGKNREAERAIVIALQLAPHDRYVLRSAARLFLHIHDPEHAHDLLRTNEATKYDPWLMASEIAISAIAERNPAFFRSGRLLLESGNFLPKHFSELASAIATIHLREGNRKARRFFLDSLIDPNGNSLAQAEWATPKIGALVKPQTIERVKDSAEAKVFQAYWLGDFPNVIQACHLWHEEEPFSSRPHIFGSGVAIAIEDFETALKFTDDGLKANPDVPILHNNRAFALIALGRIDEALSVILHALEKYTEESAPALVATAGMLALRTGQLDEGRKRYKQAISFFRRTRNITSEALACAYYAQEAARAELSDVPAILAEAENVCKNLQHVPEATIVLQRAKLWAGAVGHRRALEQT